MGDEGSRELLKLG